VLISPEGFAWKVKGLQQKIEAQEALRKLSISAEKLGVPTEATVHLDRFAKALQSAKANKPKRDSTLHSYFTKKN
jgi:hypothetical protein